MAETSNYITFSLGETSNYINFSLAKTQNCIIFSLAEKHPWWEIILYDLSVGEKHISDQFTLNF